MPDSVGFGGELGLLKAARVGGVRTPKVMTDGGLPPLVTPIPAALVVDTANNASPERLERSDESPVIGSGLDWPLAATVMGGTGALRIPLPLILAHMVAGGHSSADCGWRVSDAGRALPERRLSLDRCLATYLTHATDRLVETGVPVTRSIFAVPNAMPLADMSKVLQSTGRRVRLIWRPVAALIGAINSNPQAFDRLSEDSRVLVLYMGIDGFEATFLHVIRRAGEKGPELLVPGRLRVSSDSNVHRPLAGLLRWMRDRRTDGAHGGIGASWARAWLCSLSTTPSGLSAQDWLDGPWDKVEEASPDGPWGWFCQQVVEQRSALDYRIASEGFAREVVGLIRGSAPPSAVVLAGVFAHPDCDIVRQVLDALPNRCTCAHSTWSVAEGAAVFGWRESMQWATYSDYLPQMEICAERDGIPEWASVVDSEWIDAGTPFRNSTTGFKLRKPPAGATDRRVELAVAMEGHEFVRVTQDIVRFPEAATAGDVPLTIQIEVQAASGEPTVTAVPQGDISPVVLDWGIASCTGQTPDGYIQGLPRSFPPLESVKGAPWWSQRMNYRTVSYSGQVLTPRQFVELAVLPNVRRGAPSRELLAELRKHVIKRYWNRDRRHWESLVSSEGETQFHPEGMNELQQLLFSWLQSHLGPSNQLKPSVRRDVIKILAWTCFKSVAFERLIADRIESEVDWIHAAGNAIRSPGRGAAVIRNLGSRLRSQLLGTAPGDEVKRVNDPMKQLAWLLALRGGISQDVPSPEMKEIAESAFECAVNLEQHENLNVKFRWAIRCLLLCLMHRQHDSDFMDPTDELSRKMLRFCGKLYLRIGPKDDFAARIALEQGLRNVGPEASKPAVARDLQTFMEYLERRGSGSIIVESESDDDD